MKLSGHTKIIEISKLKFLDRKTLYLKQMNIIKTKTYNLRKCNAFPEKNFFEEMNKLSYDYQKSYYKRSNKNKI